MNISEIRKPKASFADFLGNNSIDLSKIESSPEKNTSIDKILESSSEKKIESIVDNPFSKQIVSEEKRKSIKKIEEKRESIKINQEIRYSIKLTEGKRESLLYNEEKKVTMKKTEEKRQSLSPIEEKRVTIPKTEEKRESIKKIEEKRESIEKNEEYIKKNKRESIKTEQKDFNDSENKSYNQEDKLESFDSSLNKEIEPMPETAKSIEDNKPKTNNQFLGEGEQPDYLPHPPVPKSPMHRSGTPFLKHSYTIVEHKVDFNIGNQNSYIPKYLDDTLVEKESKEKEQDPNISWSPIRKHSFHVTLKIKYFFLIIKINSKY